MLFFLNSIFSSISLLLFPHLIFTSSIVVFSQSCILNIFAILSGLLLTNVIFLQSFFIILLSTVNSSKCNHYYVIFFFQKSNLPNLSSNLFSYCQSLPVAVFLSLFSCWQSNQQQIQSCVIKNFSLIALPFDNSIPIYLSLYTIYLTTISVLISYQLSNQKLSIIPKKGISTLDTSLLDSAVSLCRQVTSGFYSTRLLPKNYLSVHKRVMSRRLTVDFIYFYFLSFVLFFLFFSFLFSIFRTT